MFSFKQMALYYAVVSSKLSRGSRPRKPQKRGKCYIMYSGVWISLHFINNVCTTSISSSLRSPFSNLKVKKVICSAFKLELSTNMAYSKTLILLLCQLLTAVTVSNAEPQVQQAQRPIYGSAANGPPPRPQPQVFSFLFHYLCILITEN